MPSSRDKVGVLDIGSNSIRLIVYDRLKRTPLPLFNEKVLCGLARGLEKTGRLSPKGVKSAYRVLDRFEYMIQAMRVTRLYVVATAAIRDSTDGRDFVLAIEKKYGFQVRILTGEEEARYAALGVISSMFEAEGLVGDLGGGSFELAQIKYSCADKKRRAEESVENMVSFPIGALRLLGRAKKDNEKAREIIAQTLAGYPIQERVQGRTFFAVGGGFRALAKIHIARTHYPLNILDHYRVTPEELMDTIRLVANAKPRQLKRLPAISEKRVDVLPYTALVLEYIMQQGRPSDIMFSVQGVREGVLFDQLDEATRQSDPLIEACCDMIRHITPDASNEWVDFGFELYDWMTPIFKDNPLSIGRLRLAACILSRLAWYEHKAYQSEMAFRWILDATLPGLSHRQRMFVAMAVFHRYQALPVRAVTGPSQTLMSKEQVRTARMMGLAMKTAYTISGGAPGILNKVPLTLEGGKRLTIEQNTFTKALISDSLSASLRKLESLMKFPVSTD